MKKIFLLLVLISGFGMLQGCEEINNLVNLTPPKNAYDQLKLDSAYNTSPVPAAQPKNVLIEDFTAVHCDNCPNAQKRGDGIISSSPAGRVSVIGIHCTTLADPGPGYPDFRTAHGDVLINYIGDNKVVGLPTGDVNRKIFPGDAIATTSYGEWGANAISELALNANVNLDIVSKSYDPVSRVFSMKVSATFVKDFTVPVYFSAALEESGMKGKQLTPSGVMDTFTFEHVLRKFMEPYNGLQLSPTPAKGNTCVVTFSTMLENSWNADNCKMVFFVHQRAVDKNDVEQVMETTLK